MHSNSEIKRFIDDLIKNISIANSVEDLKLIHNSNSYYAEITENMPGKKFPRLRFKITKDELLTLKQTGMISDEDKLSVEVASGAITLSPLEKLLYSILWKNGDLGKEGHLINGIMDSAHSGQHGVVFHEFGRYISGKNNYILDQHTLRCIAIFSSKGGEVEKARKLGAINGKNEDHQKWIDLYKNFYADLKVDGGDSDFYYYVDEIGRASCRERVSSPV